MKNYNLSVTIATYNEQSNLARCLESIKNIADEIIIVDGESSDQTVDIAEKYDAKIKIQPNPTNFHINKQLANDLAQGKWILQLDADEVVTKELANEISQIINLTQSEVNTWPINPHHKTLFIRQQQQLEKRDGSNIGRPNGDVVAFFIPRRNFFLGHPMSFTGVYPDGVIRLFQKQYAHLPAKHVHEQYHVDGKVSWLNFDLEHYDSPNFDRYLIRNARYASLFAQDLINQTIDPNFANTIRFIFLKPLFIFLNLYLRHGGYKDGFPGLVFSLYSGLTWSQAYIKYWESIKHKDK